ncbi:MAG: Imm32 family immunity protein [Ruminiclostridium sp.]
MLTSEAINNLKKCCYELNSINDDLLSEKIVDHYLEIIENKSEVVIRGNIEGLIYLANAILELALERKDDRHFHLDETGIVNKCDKELIISYKSAEWDL